MDVVASAGGAVVDTLHALQVPAANVTEPRPFQKGGSVPLGWGDTIPRKVVHEGGGHPLGIEGCGGGGDPPVASGRGCAVFYSLEELPCW